MNEQDPAERAAAEIRELSRLADRVAKELTDSIVDLAELVSARLRAGRKLLFCGNGGSAADAQHLAAEYVVRFRRSRPALRAIALTADSSVLTAAANDDGYETVFARQVEALGDPGDILFMHSTSGESENVLLAARVARERGLTTVALLAGEGGRIRDHADHALIVPTEVTSRAQEIHLAVGHVICELVESRLETEGEERDG